MRLLIFLLVSFPAFSQLNGTFIQNKKQWAKSIYYRLSLPNQKFYFQKNKLTINLFKPVYPSYSKSHGYHVHAAPAKIKGHSFSMTFGNANSNSQIEGRAPESYYFNSFVGAEANWSGKIPVYKRLVYQNLYPDIDLHLKPVRASLKYEFRLAPGADPNAIQIIYDGLEKIYVRDNHVYMVTSIDTLIDSPPLSYQIIAGDTVIIETVYQLQDNILTYAFPDGYDRGEALIIDPTLRFATVSGAGSDNRGTIALGAENKNSYSFGRLLGFTFVTAKGGFDQTFNGDSDISILKFNETGQLLYSTLLGGRGAEDAHAARIDVNNDLVIVGTTGSDDFPTTAGAFDRSYAGGGVGITFAQNGSYLSSDMFIMRIAAAGDRIMASTYLGGRSGDGFNFFQSFGFSTFSGNDFASEGYMNISFDKANNIYVAANTSSSDIAPGIQRGRLSGIQDGFVARLTADLSSLTWLTYIGATETETATDLALLSSGNVVVVGTTRSSNFPTSAGTLNTTYQGDGDGYVAIIDGASGAILKTTLLGTTAADIGLFVDTDFDDNIVVMGHSRGNYPVTSGAYTFGTTNRRIFFHKLNSNLDRTIFSSVIRALSSAKGFAVDACANLHLVGLASSTMPTTSDAIQGTRADFSDLYYLYLSADGTSLKYGTYYGGDASSGGIAEHTNGSRINLNKDGNIAIANCACASGSNTAFPTTAGAFATRIGAFCNQSIVRFDVGLSKRENLRFATAAPPSTCSPVTVNFTNNSVARTNFTWDPGDGSPKVNTRNLTHTYRRGGTYIVQLSADCAKSAFDTITVHSANIQTQKDEVICVNDTVALKVGGGIRYSWRPATGLSATNIPNPSAFPRVSTTYFVDIDNGSCIYYDTVKITVIQNLKVDFDAKVEQTCDSIQAVSITNNTVVDPPLALDYTWTTGDGQVIVGDIDQIKFNKTGSLLIHLKAGKGRCLKTDSMRLDIGPSSKYLPQSQVVTNIYSTSSCGVNDPIQLEAQGGVRYIWTPANGLSDPNIPNPIARPATSTTYRVRVINAFGCEVQRQITIQVPPQIALNISSSARRKSCKDVPQVEFVNKTINASSYFWDFGDGKTSTEEAPVHLYDKSGQYTVKFEAKDLNNCSKDTTFKINLEQAMGYNAFSPNGDGLNDVFNTQLTGWDIEIFNRWGNLVYKQDNYKNNWGAEKQTAGTYYYVLTSPENIVCRGWVSVLK